MTSSRYRADPHEARTDLMLEGIAVLKVLVGAALFLGLVWTAPKMRHWQVLIPWIFLVSVELVVLEVGASALAKRRGRADPRSVQQIAMDALGIVRRYWFLVIYPLLSSIGVPAWAIIACSGILIYAIETGIDWLRLRVTELDVVAGAPRRPPRPERES